MSFNAPPTLAQHLRSEARLLALETPRRTSEWAGCSGPKCSDALRVPLELSGSVWCAEVEEVSNEHLRLIVDRRAVAHRADDLEAAIRYQPDNCTMQRTVGVLKSKNLLSGDRMRVEFSPS